MKNALQYLMEKVGEVKTVEELKKGLEFDNDMLEKAKKKNDSEAIERFTQSIKNKQELIDKKSTSSEEDTGASDTQPKKSGSRLRTKEDIEDAIKKAEDSLKKAKENPDKEKSKTSIEYWEAALENHQAELEQIKGGKDVASNDNDKDVHDKHDIVDAAEEKYKNAQNSTKTAEEALKADPTNTELQDQVDAAKQAEDAAKSALDKAESDKDESMKAAKEARQKATQAVIDAELAPVDPDTTDPEAATIPTKEGLPSSTPPAIMTNQKEVFDSVNKATEEITQRAIETDAEQEALNNLAGKTASKMAKHNREGLVKKIAQNSGKFALKLLKGLASGIQIDDKDMDSLVSDNLAAEIVTTSLEGLDEERKKAIVKRIKGPFRDAIDRIDAQIEAKNEEIEKEEKRIEDSAEADQKAEDDATAKIESLKKESEGNETIKKYNSLLEDLHEELDKVEKQIDDKRVSVAQKQQKSISAGEQPKLESYRFSHFYKLPLIVENTDANYEPPKTIPEIEEAIKNAESQLEASKLVHDYEVAMYWENAIEGHKEDLELLKQSEKDGSEFIPSNPGKCPEFADAETLEKNQKNPPSKDQYKTELEKRKRERVSYRKDKAEQIFKENELKHSNVKSQKTNLNNSISVIKRKLTEPSGNTYENTQELSKLQSELDKTNKEYDELDNKLYKAERANKKHTKLHDDLVREPVTAPKYTKNDEDIIASIRASYKTNDETSTENSKLESEHSEAEAEHTKNIQELKDLELKKSQSVSDKDFNTSKSNLEAHDRNVENLRDRLDKIKNSGTSTEEEIRVARDALAAASSDLDAATMAHDDLASSYISPKAISDAKSIVDKSAKAVETAKTNYNNHSTKHGIDSSVKSLEKKRDTIKDHIKLIENKISSLQKPFEDEIKHIESNTSKKGAKLKQLQAELKALEDKRKKADDAYRKIESKEAERDANESYKFVSDRKSINYIIEYVREIKLEK